METKTTKTDKDGEVIIIETMDNSFQNSIKLSQNAKGEFAWEVKIYEDDVAHAEAKLKAYKDVAMKAMR